MRNRTPAACAALLVVLLTTLATTAAAPASAAAEWRPAPLWGADVRSLVIHPEDPDLVLAGTSAGQVYLSKNGGKRWSDAGPALPFPGWVVSALHFDPNQPSRLWASLWGIWGSGHVAFSDDLGKSWVARAKGLPDEPVYSLALVPGRAGRLYAGTLSGVYGTSDGGESWRYLTGDLPEIQKVTSLLVDTEAGTVIAGTWRRAYRSGDNGKTWAGVFEGMVLDSEVFSLTPIPGRPGEIWATTCGWVYQSKNGGDKWERFKDGFSERRTPSFAALSDGRLLAGTVAGLHVSEDGKNWKLIGDPALAIHIIAHHPARPGRVILGTEGSGVWISDDGAASFRRSSAGMTNTRVSALALSGDDLFVALSHAGPLSGAYVSKDRGRTWAAEFAPLPPVLEFAAAPAGDRVYAATERGLYERRGTGWFRLKELGEGRVEQVAINGERVVARTPSALYELTGGRFIPRPFKEGTPRSIAFFGSALWVSDGKGLYQLVEKANEPNAPVAAPPAPMSGGRLQRLQDQLLLSGPGGAWLRGGPESLWIELTGKPSRVLPTGDPRFPALMVSGETARLYDREARKLRILDVPVPARDISAALVVDGKLLMGTSGYGLLIHELAPAVEKPVAVAAGGGTER